MSNGIPLHLSPQNYGSHVNNDHIIYSSNPYSITLPSAPNGPNQYPVATTHVLVAPNGVTHTFPPGTVFSAAQPYYTPSHSHQQFLTTIPSVPIRSPSGVIEPNHPNAVYYQAGCAHDHHHAVASGGSTNPLPMVTVAPAPAPSSHAYPLHHTTSAPVLVPQRNQPAPEERRRSQTIAVSPPRAVSPMPAMAPAQPRLQRSMSSAPTYHEVTPPAALPPRPAYKQSPQSVAVSQDTALLRTGSSGAISKPPAKASAADGLAAVAAAAAAMGRANSSDTGRTSLSLGNAPNASSAASSSTLAPVALSNATAGTSPRAGLVAKPAAARPKAVRLGGDTPPPPLPPRPPAEKEPALAVPAVHTSSSSASRELPQRPQPQHQKPALGEVKPVPLARKPAAPRPIGIRESVMMPSLGGLALRFAAPMSVASGSVPARPPPETPGVPSVPLPTDLNKYFATVFKGHDLAAKALEEECSLQFENALNYHLQAIDAWQAGIREEKDAEARQRLRERIAEHLERATALQHASDPSAGPLLTQSTPLASAPPPTRALPKLPPGASSPVPPPRPNVPAPPLPAVAARAAAYRASIYQPFVDYAEGEAANQPTHVNMNVSAKKVPMGTQVDAQHSSYALVQALLTGMEASRKENRKAPTHQALGTAVYQESTFHFKKESHAAFRRDFDFVDHAPAVFSCLRASYAGLAHDYSTSFQSTFYQLGSPGKSGSRFFITSNGRYIIKTLKQEEFEFLLSILVCYHEHMEQNPSTLLNRFFALHTLRFTDMTPGGAELIIEEHFVVMENLFPPDRNIHEIYDLKGSTDGRAASAAERAKKKAVVLKDLDLKRTLHLSPQTRAALLEQAKKDTYFLETLNVMDYSLLLLVHKLPSGATVKRDAQPVSQFKADEGGIQARDERDRPLGELYYIGIIDLLQSYNLSKMLENTWKSLTREEDTISCVPAAKYRRRFDQFLERIVTPAGNNS